MFFPHKSVTASRDVPAIEVPAGLPTTINSGSELLLVQRRGGTFTLQSAYGGLARVDEAHADAFGLEPLEPGAIVAEEAAAFSEDKVWSELKQCFDPEIPVNIVDLGLIYECKIADLPDGGGKKIDIQMGLTAPGCGMGDVLRSDVDRRLKSLPGVREVHVELVSYPPWDPSRMSEEARLELGL